MKKKNVWERVLPFAFMELGFLKRPTEIDTKVNKWMNIKRPHLPNRDKKVSDQKLNMIWKHL